MNSTNLRLLLPETLWLEPEHFTQAQRQSELSSERSGQSLGQESEQWRVYIQTLAQLSFRDWIRVKLPDYRLVEGESDAAVGYLTIGEFKVCLIATEHVLDELVSIPRAAIARPGQCAHYYVLIEVLEDQQEAIIRGFLRYDELTDYLGRAIALHGTHQSAYCIPLSYLDSEPDHLVTYLQQLSPSAIPLPTRTVDSAMATLQTATRRLSEVTARLGQWIEGSLTEGWQTFDSLVNLERTLGSATRSNSDEMKAGKLIDLGFQLEACEVVLLVTVVPEADGKRGVQVQVLPSENRSFIPEQLTIALISSQGEVLQSVTARDRDNFIQLRSFKGKPGVRFSVELTLNDIQVKEDFEL